ncbi:MAG: hypothetical protein KBT04_08120 [Bacteroidales bacterium]|nr:hypothetical protein [Candidatus Colimorpha onthohippi]
MWLLISNITVVVFGITILLLVWLRRRSAIKRLRQLADEAETSRQQIIIEQNRNRQIKQEMTNNIAHELKTPVASIRGYLEILLSGRPIDPNRRQYFLDRCYQQTLRLSSLINDVSLINKLEESSDLFPIEPVDLYLVANEAVNELSDRAEADRVLVFNNLPSDVIVQGNKGLLYAIFRNLIENAISYAGQDIRVVMECYKSDADHYYLHFYDTGCGVASEYLPKLFDRFLRIDSGRSRKMGGTGLGLSIVKHAVLFHGGDIYANNRPDGGLEFFFSIKTDNRN